ncbi:MAG: hypothetical protein O3B84_06350, partial [Chloroflexi bacterium]|nr:hypothetical protein [Chloroflexota bacterium]
MERPALNQRTFGFAISVMHRNPKSLGLAWIGVLAVLIGGCSAVQTAFQAPLPPADTLALQAILVPGGGGGTKTIRISWKPPDESVDFVVIEESRGTEQGPWQEIATVRSQRGFHEEAAVYRPGRFYYFRGILVRGNEETRPTPTLSMWIPFEAAEPSPTPRPPAPPTPFP